MALKTYNPTSPGRRHLIQVDKFDPLEGQAPVKTLVEGKTKTGGRNSDGRITSRHIGGGAKQAYRRIDFRRRKFDAPASVERLEYDPNRTAFIALIKYHGRHAGLHSGAAALGCRRHRRLRSEGRREAG